MTKEMGSGEERGRVRGTGGERERERECNVISCATEPHSRHGRNSRSPGYGEKLKGTDSFLFCHLI